MGTERFLLYAVFGSMVAFSFGADGTAQEKQVILRKRSLFPSWLEQPKSLRAEEGEETEGSESEGEIETDRDSFTPATTITPRRRIIIESAYSFLDNRGRSETHSFPEFLLRYGLTKRIELRLGANYEVGSGGSVSSATAGSEEDETTQLERSSIVNYGLKVLVTEQQRWIPGSALIFQGSTPTSGMETATQFTGVYVFGWELENRVKLDAAIRYDTVSERGDRFGVWSPSAVVKVPIGEKINVHAEYFSFFSRGREQDFVRHFVSPGVHYLITPDLEVGVRIGWGLNDQTSRFFTNVGFGYRF
jgi:hypothetical protein